MIELEFRLQKVVTGREIRLRNEKRSFELAQNTAAK
jgi:hypothetical protein